MVPKTTAFIKKRGDYEFQKLGQGKTEWIFPVFSFWEKAVHIRCLCLENRYFWHRKNKNC